MRPKSGNSASPGASQSLPPYLRQDAEGLLLAIKLQPRAAVNQIGDPLASELRVRVTAPPVDAAANEALIRLLAEQLDWPRSKIQLLRGHTSRHKTLKIYGLTAAQLLGKLQS
jgi:hypothetical protein